MRRVLVTGSAGFVGARTAELLLQRGDRVLGIDNLNAYYDTRLKRHRLDALARFARFRFVRADIEDFEAVERSFARFRPEAVVNLAARAGVRYSLEDPFVYLRTNALGTLNLLELCRRHRTPKFVLASTSSLYAAETPPFREAYPVNTPVSPYAATKKCAEVLAYTYHYLYGIDVTVFRYFTVYGPAGRPDMSVFRFIKWIDEGTPVVLYGDGSQKRDFTYIDDIARGTVMGLKRVGFRTINLGGHRPHTVRELIRRVEKHLGKKARIERRPFHRADLRVTYADVSQARRILGWTPRVSFEEGIRRTVRWYRENRALVGKVKVAEPPSGDLGRTSGP